MANHRPLGTSSQMTHTPHTCTALRLFKYLWSIWESSLLPSVLKFPDRHINRVTDELFLMIITFCYGSMYSDCLLAKILLSLQVFFTLNKTALQGMYIPTHISTGSLKYLY